MENEQKFFDSINRFSRNDFDEGDVQEFFDSAFSLLKMASKKSRIRDEFEGFYYEPRGLFNCFLRSQKTNTTYSLLFDPYTNELTFYTDLCNWENVRNISDSFWKELTDIAINHNVQFSALSGPFYDKEKTPEFNSHYKSIVFNLMSVYITAMLEPDFKRQNISFGQLEVVWKSDKDTGDIIKKLNLLFKLFYKFNYLLWKSEDIRKQNRNNRRKKKK